MLVHPGSMDLHEPGCISRRENHVAGGGVELLWDLRTALDCLRMGSLREHVAGVRHPCGCMRVLRMMPATENAAVQLQMVQVWDCIGMEACCRAGLADSVGATLVADQLRAPCARQNRVGILHDAAGRAGGPVSLWAVIVIVVVVFVCVDVTDVHRWLVAAFLSLLA